jgi:hypothetical protein
MVGRHHQTYGVSAMSNANELAFPCTAAKPWHAGLTKREYFAAMAMQGLLAGEYRDTSDKQLQWVSDWAVKHADALLAELERTK